MKILKNAFVSVIAFGFLFTAATYAQTPNIVWHKTLGGTVNDKAYQIVQVTGSKNNTGDGYIVVGETASNNGDVTGQHGCGDYWVARLSTTGQIIWKKTLGGTYTDSGRSIQQTSDGGYIVAGFANSINGDVTGHHGSGFGDYWVVKLAPDTGTSTPPAIQWQKSLGGTANDFADSVQQTTDGGYIIAGYSVSTDGDVTGNHGDYDYWVVKLNSAGMLMWQKTLGGTGDDRAFSIQQTSDGGYIVAGESNSTDGNVTGNHGNYDYWVVKLNSAGTLMWQKTLGASADDHARSIQQTSDGGYVVAGYSRSTVGDYNFLVVKLSPTTGNTPPTIQWQKTLGGTVDDYAFSIQQTSDGGYIVAGESNSNNGDVTGNHGSSRYDYWVVKLSPTTGNTPPTIQWQKTLGGTVDDYAFSIQQTNDGGYIVAGESNSNDGDVTGNHGGSDYWVVKLDGGLAGVSNVASYDKNVNVYPNPTRGKFTVKYKGLTNPTVKIYNVAGQEVKSTKGSGSEPVEFDLSDNAKGTYIIKVQNGKNIITKKIIVK